MGITLDQLVFDTTNPSESANVGAYLRDSAGNFITSTLIGSNQALDVNVINGSQDGYYLEDSAAANGDIGSYVLAVLQGTLSSSAGDGDYGSFKTDLLGRLWVNRSGQTMTNGNVLVTSTATDLIGTDLANRIKVIVQNIDNKVVYLGKDNTVTTSDGIVLNPGSSIELEVGPSVNLHGITSTGSANLRYLEVA